MERGLGGEVVLSVSEAQALILAQARSFGTEKIALEKSFGRVLAKDVRADRDYPPFNRSMMDGYAVIAKHYAAAKTYHVTRTVFAGDAPLLARDLSRGQAEAIKIMTGAAVPAPFNAVIRREDAIQEGTSVRFSLTGLKEWHNISRQGEDLARKDKVSVQGRPLDAPAVGFLAALGIVRPQVARMPSVAIISTGNEIIPPAKKPKPAEIRNSNVFALRAMLTQFGITKVVAMHVADDQKKLRAAISKFGKADVLLVTGGVSAGDSDHVPDALAKLKFRKVFHKVQLKPGKPLWFGKRGKTTVFAIPGNPFSAQVVFRIFIEPYLRQCLGMQMSAAMALPLATPRRKKDSLQHFFPVKIETVASFPSTLTALPFNSSGDIKAALFSDGIAVHPAEIAELSEGSVVEFYPWGSL